MVVRICHSIESCDEGQKFLIHQQGQHSWYNLRQQVEIERIFTDGRYELDNNPIEREMRSIAIGRKNYLFAGSHEGARRAAIIYSLLGTLRLHKVNPIEWLQQVFTNMRECSVNQVATLLPHRYLPHSG